MDKQPKTWGYEIHVGGILSDRMLGAFPGLRARGMGGVTVLFGDLPDQAALHGVLARIESLGLELIEVRRSTPNLDGPGTVGRRAATRG